VILNRKFHFPRVQWNRFHCTLCECNCTIRFIPLHSLCFRSWIYLMNVYKNFHSIISIYKTLQLLFNRVRRQQILNGCLPRLARWRREPQKGAWFIPWTSQEFELQTHPPKYFLVKMRVFPVFYLQFPSTVSYSQHFVILVLGVLLLVQVCNKLKCIN
jgi:hypothetical protein